MQRQSERPVSPLVASNRRRSLPSAPVDGKAFTAGKALHTGAFPAAEPRFVGRWNNQWQLAERTRLERAIQDRDGAGCFYCDSTLTRTVDHVDARAGGGGDELGNLVFACRVCNWSKLAAPAWLYVFWVAAFGPCRIKRRASLGVGLADTTGRRAVSAPTRERSDARELRSVVA